MSIKPFTNEELGISQMERKALVTMRKLLLRTPARKTVVIKRDVYTTKLDGCLMPNFKGPTFFNMGTSAENTECGTVCCIGGGMALLMGKGRVAAENYVSGHGPLNDLFYPTKANGEQYGSFNKITPKQAAQAIENFLFCGKPRWPIVLSR